MDLSREIKRGQVWNIDDDLQKMMAMVREYNREYPDYWGYTKGVVIVKSTKMINTPSLNPLVVVPLVTTKRYESDIKIPRMLLSSYASDNVYPLVGSLFTVDYTHLVDYVCTLSEVYMSEIDKRLQELLFD